jgi:hypothetical protein
MTRIPEIHNGLHWRRLATIGAAFARCGSTSRIQPKVRWTLLENTICNLHGALAQFHQVGLGGGSFPPENRPNKPLNRARQVGRFFKYQGSWRRPG